MPLVLLNRRGDSNVLLAIISLEFPFRSNLKLIGVVLGLENIHIKETIDQEMVNLADLTFMLEP